MSVGQVGGFSSVTPVSTTNKTDCHDIAEILLKVGLNTIAYCSSFYLLQFVESKSVWATLWLKSVQSRRILLLMSSARVKNASIVQHIIGLPSKLLKWNMNITEMKYEYCWNEIWILLKWNRTLISKRWEKIMYWSMHYRRPNWRSRRDRMVVGFITSHMTGPTLGFSGVRVVQSLVLMYSIL